MGPDPVTEHPYLQLLNAVEAVRQLPHDHDYRRDLLDERLEEVTVLAIQLHNLTDPDEAECDCEWPARCQMCGVVDDTDYEAVPYDPLWPARPIHV